MACEAEDLILRVRTIGLPTSYNWQSPSDDKTTKAGLLTNQHFSPFSRRKKLLCQPPVRIPTLFSYQEDGDAYLQKPRRTKRRFNSKEKCLTHSLTRSIPSIRKMECDDHHLILFYYFHFLKIDSHKMQADSFFPPSFFDSPNNYNCIETTTKFSCRLFCPSSTSCCGFPLRVI